MFAILKWLLIAFVTLLLAAFAVVNRHLVTIQFYPFPIEIELPVYLLILLLFVGGFFLAWLLSRLSVARLSAQLRSSEKKRDALEEEVTRLRHQPSLPAEKK